MVRPIASVALAAAFAAASVAAPPSQSLVRDGVAVDFALLPLEAEAAAPLAGDPARVRFTITDTTTGRPLARLHPAAWFSRRGGRPGEARPQTAAEKVQELLGGSIFSQAELDLNTFRVLALNDDATITVVDPLFGFGGTKLLAMIALPGVGADWVLTPDGRRIFVAVPSAGKIAVVDTASWKISALLVAGAAPSRVAVQPDGHYAWAADATGVTAINADRAEVAARIGTGGGAHLIVFSADSHWAFVTNAADRTLTVIDVHTLKKMKDVPLGCAPAGAAYSQASEAVYLSDETGGGILVLDTVKQDLVARIGLEPGVSELKFAPGDRFGFVANPTRDRVYVFDAATNRVVQRARIEGGPEQFAFSGDMAFVRRRGTANVGMIPLQEIGREGQAVPVAEFTGGEAPFGARTSPADGIVPAPGETAVVVANPADKAIYYYMEGMAAPMGNFGNYDRQPRAVMVVDRSLREVAPGIYETTVNLPAAGDYDAVFYLDAPRIAHCFDAAIEPNPARGPSSPRHTVRLEPLPPPPLIAGVPVRLSFRLAQATTQPRAVAPADIELLSMLAPGTWHRRLPVERARDDTLTVDFAPPEPGVYYFYASSPSLGLALNNAPCLIVRVGESPPPAAK